MNEIIEIYKKLGPETTLAINVFAVIFATSLLSYLSKKIFYRLGDRFAKTQTVWDDAIIYSIRKPTRFLIWIYGLVYATSLVLTEYELGYENIFSKIEEVSFVIFLTWSLLRFIKEFEKNYIERKKNKKKKLDVTTLSAIVKLLNISVVITSFLIILQTLGFSISAVLAFGGVGGLAVGLAAKDMLSNFFGAFIIYMDKPFKVGDWIRSPDKEIEGTVETIGWRQTVIRTFDKRPLYVPNSIFNSIVVENPSRMTNRRIYEHYGVRYDDVSAVKKIVTEVEEMLRSHEEIDIKQTLMVNLNKFSDSSVEFFVYTFTKTTDWVKFHGIKEDVMLRISDIIVRHGAEFAFPTRTLHVPEELKLSGLGNEE